MHNKGGSLIFSVSHTADAYTNAKVIIVINLLRVSPPNKASDKSS